MARRVIWTETARNDLGQVADHIAKDSKHYAAALVRQARDLARSPASWAERGWVVEDLDDPNIRETVLGNYRLIYHVGARKIHIIGFLHAARDLLALWKREKRKPPAEE